MIKIFKLVIVSLLFFTQTSYSQVKTKHQKVYDKIVRANLQHPKIVLKQAVLESGNFKSSAAKNKNNILGIMQGNRIKHFNSIDECIMFYKTRIQSRYTTGDYYRFLRRIGYASDRNYTDKLKNTKLYLE